MAGASDEMLMAYADGELDREAAADIRRAIESDPALGRRLELFVRTRSQSKVAFQAVIEESVPDSILAAIRREAPARRNPSPSWLSRVRFPVAAGAAAVFALGGYLIGTSLEGNRIEPWSIPAAEIASVLERTPSGTVADVKGADVEVTGTYATADGHCRVFEVAASGATWRAIACRHSGDWTTEMMVADFGGAAGSGDFAPASDRASHSLEAFLDANGAGGRLSAVEERELIERGWSGGAGGRTE